MKRILFFLALAFLGALTFTSCKKDKNNEPQPEPLTMDQAESMAVDVTDEEAVMAEVDMQSDEMLVQFVAGGPLSGDCPTVTADQPQGTFPVTITIDFGDGCTAPDGHWRSGKIIINVSDKPTNPGATRTITLVDYHVDSLAIEGTRTWTNNGPNAQGQPSFTRTTTGAKITYPDGSFRSWETTHTLTWTAGYDTPWMRLDDEYDIEGSRNVVRKNGDSFSSVITTPLHKRFTCPYVESGVREITKNGETATLDYGDGTCDPWGTLTLPDGTTKQIKLRKWHF